LSEVPWGQTGDRPQAEGDYDGDGKVDYTVVRQNATTGNLTWFIMSSSTNTQRAFQFGTVPTGISFNVTEGADFNGDGRDELVLYTFNATTGAGLTFYIGDANTGAVCINLYFFFTNPSRTTIPIIIKMMPGMLPIRRPLNTTVKAKPKTNKPIPTALLFIINDYAKASKGLGRLLPVFLFSGFCFLLSFYIT
jgi:hypothetical protein